MYIHLNTSAVDISLQISIFVDIMYLLSNGSNTLNIIISRCSYVSHPCSQQDPARFSEAEGRPSEVLGKASSPVRFWEVTRSPGKPKGSSQAQSGSRQLSKVHRGLARPREISPCPGMPGKVCSRKV